MGLGCAAKGLFGFGRKKRSAEPETDEENFYVWMGLVKNENKVWEWTDKTPVCYKGKSPKLSKNGKPTDKSFGKLYLVSSFFDLPHWLSLPFFSVNVRLSNILWRKRGAAEQLHLPARRYDYNISQNILIDSLNLKDLIEPHIIKKFISSGKK